MHLQGVKGAEWKVLDNMYTDVSSRVKWDGSLSSPIHELQGIRQGGDSSADCYKAGKNRLLHHLDNNPSAKIGSINAGAVMVADDLALISSSPHLLQISLNSAQMDAARERYKFNNIKTQTVSINSKTSPSLLLNNAPLSSSTSETHIGITRTSSNNNTETITNRVTKARKTAYSLMGAGLHGLNGAGPLVALMMHITYVIPTLLYGLEALVLSAEEIKPLELFHRKNLRLIQHLPQSTANCAIHLLSGILPIEAQIHCRVLSLFRNILDGSDGSPPARYIKEIIARQLAIKEGQSSSWVIMVKNLLHKYDLPNAYNIQNNTPRKTQWKQTIEKAIRNHWQKHLQTEASSMTSMEFVNIEECQLGVTHPVWRWTECQLDILKATVKAQLLIKRYPLSTSRTAGMRMRDKCPLCEIEPETTSHFLLRCNKLADIRKAYLPKITTCNIPSDELVKLILDSNYGNRNNDHEILCRNFTYKLHHKRCTMLGGRSCYKLN